MGKARLKNKPIQNAFDLSERHPFSTSLGYISPICVQECLPSDRWQIGASWFTRTQSLQAASFGRFVEQVQYFFVPYSSLWKYAPQCITEVVQSTASGGSESRIASGIYDSLEMGSKLPMIRLSTIYLVLLRMAADLQLEGGAKTNGELLRPVASALLLQHLGYGNFNEFIKSENYEENTSYGGKYIMKSDVFQALTTFQSQLASNDVWVSPFRLLAYHKIWNDSYRNDTWQPYASETCNIDYITPEEPSLLDSHIKMWCTGSTAGQRKQRMMFDAEYANLPIDWYNGSLPRPQFGDASKVQVISTGAVADNSSITRGVVAGHGGLISSAALEFTAGKFNTSTGDDIHLSTGGNISEFDVKALRQAEALQKFKEISLSQDNNFADQIEAHFGVRPSDGGYDSKFITASSATYQIDPQVNNNLVGDNQPTINGLATASGNVMGDFTCDTYGIIIGVHAITPILDYAPDALDVKLTQVDAVDLPHPEMVNTGYTAMRGFEVFGFEIPDNTGFSSLDPTQTIGYRPLYAEYKVGKDRCYGEFLNTLRPWILGLQDYKDAYTTWTTSNWIPQHLQVRPSLADSVFFNNNHALSSDCQFYSNLNVIARAVRPLSVHSLPFAN